MKFKEGDRVVCKRNAFHEKALGKTGTVLGYRSSNRVGVQYDEYINGNDCSGWGVKSGKTGHCMWSFECDLELASRKHPTIIITTDGTTTTAMMRSGKEIVRTATAKCSPHDTFDHATGAKLALDRLFEVKPVKQDKAAEAELVKLYCVKSYEPGEYVTKGKIYTIEYGRIKFDDDIGCKFNESNFFIANGKDVKILSNYLIPLVNRPAKDGDGIYIENISGNDRHGVPLLHGYKAGDILFVDGKKERADEKGFIWGVGLMSTEYLVLDGYRPESEKPEVREVKREAKIGDWIRVLCAPISKFNHGLIKTDDIVLVTHYGCMPSVRRGKNLIGFRENEYVVLENYTPDNA